ncbi:hypothetical protein [Zunongwangia endophytica]|uniref:hypothetical protein n=1 Tax=Zunongwangia endophytica TaxID=1808945 RepID=UPI0025B61F90|nr:hypothetical protein [Zunongwangia endophytica]MDN3593283.1 hypothetical protein [Zunongwangia endophytica]
MNLIKKSVFRSIGLSTVPVIVVFIETKVTNLLDYAPVNGIVINSRDVTDLVEQRNDFQKVYRDMKLFQKLQVILLLIIILKVRM